MLIKIVEKKPIENVTYKKGGGNEMAATKRSGKKFFLEKRIDQFCESSAALLTGIQSRYSPKDNGEPQGKRKRKKREIISLSDLAIDMHDDEPLGDSS